MIPKENTLRTTGCLLELDAGVSNSNHVLAEMKNSHVLHVLSLEQSIVRTFGEFVLSPSSLWTHVNYRHSSPRDSSRQEAHCTREAKENYKVHAWKKRVGRQSHPHSHYPILWRMQKFSFSLTPAAPLNGALWLEEGVEAVKWPRWLSGQQCNMLLVKEIWCLDAWKAKEDAIWVPMVKDGLG